MPSELAGRRILLVEDSPVVAELAQEMLEELGCIVVGPAGNLATARILAETEAIDAGLIDVRIRGDKSFAICDILAARRLPFILTSGYADWAVAEKWRDSARLPKPYALPDLERALVELLAEAPN
ncbi:MAG TPA: response regulator [Sphingomicrobium sp.]|nr:response regulator [Sphingomicrobium sp.]